MLNLISYVSNWANGALKSVHPLYFISIRSIWSLLSGVFIKTKITNWDAQLISLEIAACSWRSNQITVTHYWCQAGRDCWKSERGRAEWDPRAIWYLPLWQSFKGDLENPIAGDLHPSKGFRDTLARLGSAPQRQWVARQGVNVKC